MAQVAQIELVPANAVALSSSRAKKTKSRKALQQRSFAYMEFDNPAGIICAHLFDSADPATIAGRDGPPEQQLDSTLRHRESSRESCEVVSQHSAVGFR